MAYKHKKHILTRIGSSQEAELRQEAPQQRNPMLADKNTRQAAAAGFYNVAEDPVERNLTVEGRIPEWVEGVLYRTGPGRFEIGNMKISHWFDGKGLNHRFSISGKENTVTYLSRESCAVQIGEEMQMQRPSGITFAQPADPCERLFSKFSSAFRPTLDSRKSATETEGPNMRANESKRSAKDSKKSAKASAVNVSVVLDSRRGDLVAHTDANVLQKLDPITLEPLEVFTYASAAANLDGPLSAAHGATIDGRTYNYVLNLGPESKYTIFSYSGYGEEAQILAEVNEAIPAYLHSIAATENHIILSVWQADYKNAGKDIALRGNIVEGLSKWDPERRTRHYVIDRFSGETKVRISSEPMFCLHHINAFEQSDSVILDLVTYANTDVLEATRLEKLRNFDVETAPMPQYRRLRLPLKKGDCDAVLVAGPRTDINIELPRINPSFHWKQARYTYGIHRSGKPESRSLFVDSIIRLDMETGDAKVWFEPGQVPGEPIFVPAPNGDEQDGVLLTISLDTASRSSKLVVLNAETMRPVAKANLNAVFPIGFHGVFKL